VSHTFNLLPGTSTPSPRASPWYPPEGHVAPRTAGGNECPGDGARRLIMTKKVLFRYSPPRPRVKTTRARWVVQLWEEMPRNPRQTNESLCLSSPVRPCPCCPSSGGRSRPPSVIASGARGGRSRRLAGVRARFRNRYAALYLNTHKRATPLRPGRRTSRPAAVCVMPPPLPRHESLPPRSTSPPRLPPTPSSRLPPSPSSAPHIRTHLEQQPASASASLISILFAGPPLLVVPLPVE